MTVRSQRLGHLQDQQTQFDELRIRLEGSLEVLASLTSQWVAAREELANHALPHASTLRALRALEVESAEAVAHCQRVSDAAFKVSALEQAQQDWVREVQKRLTHLGIPEGSTNPRQSVEHVQNLGEVEVLDVRVRKSSGFTYSGWFYAVAMALSCYGLLTPTAHPPLVGLGASLLSVGFWYAPLVQRARQARARAVLSPTSLFAQHQEPLDLATIESVGWGTWGNELRFKLTDGRVATWTIAGKPTALLDRLQALGIQLSPPRG